MRIWKWVLRALALLVLVVAVVAALVASQWALAIVFGPDPQPRVPAAIGRVWLIVLAMALTLLMLWLVTATVRHVVLAPFGSWNAFGSAPSARLLGLGAAALCFPKALVTLINAPILLVIDLVRDLPDQVYRFAGAPPAVGPHGAVPLDEWVLRLAQVLQLIGTVVAQTANRALQPIPGVDVLLAIVLWALVGQVLGPMDAAPGARNRLAAFWSALQDGQRQLIGLAVVFALGGFLSITSIVAIPWLQEDKSTPGLAVDDLQRALTSLRLDPAAVKQPLPGAGPDVPSPAEAWMKTASAPEAGAGREAAARLATLTKAVQDAERARLGAVQRAKALGNDVLTRQDQLIQKALRAYLTEGAQVMSAQERWMFHRDIVRQVGASVSALETGLADCRSSIEREDQNLRSLMRNLDARRLAQEADRSVDQQVSDRVSDLYLAEGALTRMCEALPALSRLSLVPPEPGAGWGPFGWVANWLLRTRSFALALITGMLGFGLLGAALSDIVRHGRRATARAGMAEVGRVVVRGLSAAVVLFLAVKGGLAVLSVGDQNPNAYVLFFSCLVGAVFSDDVWRWARKRFLKQWAAGAGGAAGSTPSPAPQAPAVAAPASGDAGPKG